MIGTGTIANVAAIVLGGAIGLGVRGGLKAHYQEGLMKAMGLGTLFIGAAGALAGALTVQDGKVASLGTAATLSMILALALGTLVGEFFDFDGKMEHLGIWLKAKADKRGDSQFVQGFVTASLVVCVGAMAIVGSIQDGLTGNATTLYTKAVIDGIVVMVMASVYGKGVLFAALPVGVLQGAITLCAGLLAPVFSWAWPKLASMNIRPSSITKFVIGILCAAAGFGLMMLAAQNVLSNGGAGVSPFWLVGSILMLTLGELCLSPIGLATMTLLAPERMRGQMMGLWFCASALGNLAAGLIGGHVKADQLDMLPDLFARCSIALLICAAVLIVLIVPVRRMLENAQTKPAASAS